MSVFTLNDDDVINGARNLWFDGFTRLPVQSSSGPVRTANGFDPERFVNWREESEPVSGHLYGSVRFGYADLIEAHTKRSTVSPHARGWSALGVSF